MEMEAKVTYAKRLCKYELTEKELAEIADSVNRKIRQQEELEIEKKAVMASYKEKAERLKADITSASRIYSDRFEMRDIECVVEKDFDTGEIRYVRVDTGEVAAYEKMSMADRQRRIEEFIN